jgi:hypothetical protein
MSNDIIQQLEVDLAREKEKIFFQKHKYIIISAVAVVLLSLMGYQYSQKQKIQKHQDAAIDYYNFKSFYSNIEELTDINSKPPKLLDDTINNVPDYYPMSELVRFNNARKHDVSDKELLKITNSYLKSPYKKPLTIHDSLLKLFNLSLRVDKTDFKTLESELIEYIQHPFAFKYLAYDMLFLLAIHDKNASKANHYLKILGDNIPPEAVNKLKIYQTHPLITPQIAPKVISNKIPLGDKSQ